VKVNDQIKQVNDILKDNSFLILTTLLLTIMVNWPSMENSTNYTLALLAATYLLAMFLLGLLLYQLLDGIKFEMEEGTFWKSVKEFNYILYTIIILLFLVFFALIFDYGARYSNAISAISGLFIASWLVPFLFMAIIGVPIFVAKLALAAGREKTTTRDKLLIYVPLALLMSVAIPTAIFLWRRDWEDLFIMPVFFIWVTGIIFSIEAGKDWYCGRKEKKGEDIKKE